MELTEILKKYEQEINEIHNLVTVGPHDLDEEQDLLERINEVSHDLLIDYNLCSKKENTKIKRMHKLNINLRLIFATIGTIIYFIPLINNIAFIFMLLLFSAYLFKYRKKTDEFLDHVDANKNKYQELSRCLKNYSDIINVRIHKLVAIDLCKKTDTIEKYNEIEIARMLIEDYLSYRLYNLEQVPKEIKLTMLKILQSDLQDNSESLIELLEKARIKSINNGYSLKLHRN